MSIDKRHGSPCMYENDHHKLHHDDAAIIVTCAADEAVLFLWNSRKLQIYILELRAQYMYIYGPYSLGVASQLGIYFSYTAVVAPLASNRSVLCIRAYIHLDSSTYGMVADIIN